MYPAYGYGLPRRKSHPGWNETHSFGVRENVVEKVLGVGRCVYRSKSMGAVGEAINHKTIIWVAHPADRTALIVHHLHDIQGGGLATHFLDTPGKYPSAFRQLRHAQAFVAANGEKLQHTREVNCP